MGDYRTMSERDAIPPCKYWEVSYLRSSHAYSDHGASDWGGDKPLVPAYTGRDDWERVYSQLYL